jgi:NADPH2:quinone reductase
MHAIQAEAYGDSSVLHWKELPDPEPGPGEVALKVSATGVNFADIATRRGGYPESAAPPFIPGLDCLGTIAAIGAGVSGLKIGQRVAAYPERGSYAEIAVARAILTYPVGPEVPDEAAASLNVMVTSHNILRVAGRLAPGESVLVHAAAGGVGSTAIQMARAFGAGRIFATVGSPGKVEAAKKAGADEVIDYRSEDVAMRVMAGTNERGVDVILDSVAGDVFTNGFPALAPFGRYVIFGRSSGNPANFEATKLSGDNRSVVGYSSGGYRKRRPDGLIPAVQASFALAAQGLVKVVVGARFALRDAAKAQDLVESRQSVGKVLLIN